MPATTFLLWLVQGLVQWPQPAGDGLDEAARERMRQRAERLSMEMARLMQELEHQSLEQGPGAWGALLAWQFWALVAILVLFSALCFGVQTIRHHADNCGQKDSSGSNTEEEDNVVAQDNIECKDGNWEEDKDGNKEGSGVDVKEKGHGGNKAKQGSNNAKKAVYNEQKGEEVSAAGNDNNKHHATEEDEDHNVNNNLGGLSAERIQLPVVEVDKGCSVICDLMARLTDVLRQGLSRNFYPVPQEAIGVGSDFEGWSPCAEGVVYQVLVPLSPPPGHAFHLELDTAGMAQRNFWVRVELLCTCSSRQLREDMLCFLHHPELELRREQEPSLLHTLCTSSYLDVEQTAQWFCCFVRLAWMLLPQSCHWRLTLLSSRRSCRVQLSKEKESLMAEMIFGVRRGDSDIFVGSQPSAVGMPSTTWIETCAMAEAKFFRHISRQAPKDSCHCKCLQLLSHSLVGVSLSSYTLKTVLMHLLSTVPLAGWHSRDFPWRMMDIVEYLLCSLQTKQLQHFVIGNERLPGEISLPSDLRLAEAPNLLQQLASDPNAHRKAVQECIHLLHRLQQLLLCGH
ncbi:inositol 1,4,5-trisphosphate receptor-interacting protein-like 1 [Molothrus aeneus]|uniref:inositol 1,4,5-trisphosphate receptor-interacting protein-like 1 n=1 Tax=Molothrus aeneus TaxID=84833 RepID=UPI003459C4F3